MVEVFKTNVQGVRVSKMIVQRLLEHFPESRINFDLEDRDKVLRIEAITITDGKIIELLNSAGYHCEVLT